AGLIRRRDSLRAAAGIDPRAKQIPLRGIVRRSVEVNPTFARIDCVDADYIEISRGNVAHIAAVASYRVDMMPAVAFAGPQKSFAAVDPFQISARQAVPVPVNIEQTYGHPALALLAHL